jgi:hypothetical protein
LGNGKLEDGPRTGEGRRLKPPLGNCHETDRRLRSYVLVTVPVAEDPMSPLKHAITATIALTLTTNPALPAQQLGSELRRSLTTVHTWDDGPVLRAGRSDTATAASLRQVFERSRATVEGFFGSPFPEPIAITIVSDRDAFTAVLRAEWGVPETACWMVATGVAGFVVMLSPRVWPEQACEHDPTDREHVSDIITHELTHVYHGQRHASRDFDFEGAEEMSWFLVRTGNSCGRAVGPRPARSTGSSGERRGSTYAAPGRLVRHVSLRSIGLHGPVHR